MEEKYLTFEECLARVLCISVEEVCNLNEEEIDAEIILEAENMWNNQYDTIW